MIEINGKQVQTRYGMLATEIVLSKADEMYGLSYYSTLGIVNIIWAGIVNYYSAKGIAMPVTFEEVYDYVEQCSIENKPDALQAEIKGFEQSQALQAKTEQLAQATEEIKKKMLASAQENLPTKQD